MKYYFIIILVVFFKASSLMAVYESKDILNQVHIFLGSKQNNIEYKINEKIKIPNCFGNIQIKEKYDSLKTLEIICLGEKSWKYNLRTNISSKNIKKRQKNKLKKNKIPVLVTLVRLKRGHQIKESDIKVKYLSHIGSSNTFTKTKALLGRKIKVPLKEGQIIRERHLIKNWVIKEGQKVKIEHQKGNLLILVDGIALNSGMEGDYLEVKNENSGKIIKGWVKNNKKITIFR
tara:strand:+ start:842 stop:1537 length:696 start_codon:yes stop_codon:yes gene_type:complete